MRREIIALGAIGVLLALLLSGCTGGFAPTLPSPDGDRGRSTITTDSNGDLLPDGLGVGAFAVTLDEAPTTVLEAVPSRSAGISICFILDSTGSMGDEIDAVINSIESFAAEFTGISVTWSGMEYGDATPSDGLNTWDFFGQSRRRTMVQVSSNLADLQAWLAPIVAVGGGDTPENPLKALMEARTTMRWPSGAARHFIVLTDVGAHQRSDGATDPDSGGRPDGAPFSPFEGSEVLAAFRGWGTIHAVSPDLSDAWSEAEAAQANNGDVSTQAVSGWAGWDVRELTDGGPPAFRTHDGTGGRWVQMPAGGNVDLTELGIAEYIRQSYVIAYDVPEDMDSAHVVITATYLVGGVPHVSTFDLGIVTF